MDWICLGHAMWLVEGAGLRLLCDPLLEVTHHCGVFEVVPRRTIDAEALRADFILVSHRHPDHFDVPSLAKLAQLDPHSVIVTPDRLVGWAASELGFRSVQIVPPGQRVELDGLTLVTTPSVSPDEWGVMVGTADGVVWNQVDTVLEGPDHVRDVVATCLESLEAPAVTLALVRWSPLLEIAAPLGRRTAFPYAEYARLFEQVAAVGARAVVPASAGAAHTEAFGWMDRFVYPISERRFVADLERACPELQVLPGRMGGRYRLRGGEVSFDPDADRQLVTWRGPRSDPRAFKPFEIPPLRDPNPSGTNVDEMRARVRSWIRGDLTRGLVAGYESMRAGGATLRFVVEVVFPSTTDAFTIAFDGGRAEVEERFDPDWDALNGVAGSLLWEVIEGRRHWGDVLLAGALRAFTRAYAVSGGHIQPANVGETFLYYALSYDDAVRRAVEWEVERAKSARSST